MVEPLLLEEFCSMIESYPLIFEVEEPGSTTGVVGLQPEFVSFVYSHKDAFKTAVDSAVDRLRGTGATWGEAIADGFGHMIELFLGRPSVDQHLPIAVATMYEIHNPRAWARIWLEEEI